MGQTRLLVLLCRLSLVMLDRSHVAAVITALTSSCHVFRGN